MQKCLKAAVEEKVNLRIGEAKKNIRTVVAVVGYTNAGKSSLIKRLFAICFSFPMKNGIDEYEIISEK